MDKIAEKLTELFEEESDHMRICGCDKCAKRTERVKAILDIITSEQAPMVEALKLAQGELGYFKAGLNPASSTDEALEAIDAVLPKGEGK